MQPYTVFSSPFFFWSKSISIREYYIHKGPKLITSRPHNFWRDYLPRFLIFRNGTSLSADWISSRQKASVPADLESSQTSKLAIMHWCNHEYSQQFFSERKILSILDTIFNHRGRKRRFMKNYELLSRPLQKRGKTRQFFPFFFPFRWSHKWRRKKSRIFHQLLEHQEPSSANYIWFCVRKLHLDTAVNMNWQAHSGKICILRETVRRIFDQTFSSFWENMPEANLAGEKYYSKMEFCF